MSMRERFERFHARHPEVYDGLLGLCTRWIAYGNKGRWSIWAAFAVLRWERRIAGLPDDDEIYKLNNYYTGYYARLLLVENPGLGDLFELRRMKDE